MCAPALVVLICMYVCVDRGYWLFSQNAWIYFFLTSTVIVVKMRKADGFVIDSVVVFSVNFVLIISKVKCCVVSGEMTSIATAMPDSNNIDFNV